MAREEILRIVVSVALALLFLTILLSIYQFLYLLKQHEVLKKAWEKSIKVLNTKKQTRKQLEKSNAALYGEMEAKTIMAKLDSALAYSGIYVRFPTWSVEYFTAGLLMGVMIEIALVWLFSKSILLALFASMLTVFIIFQLLQTARAIRKRKIDAELLSFFDLMEKAIITSKDIVNVLSKVENRLKGPLKKEIFCTIVEAESTGNVSYAFRHMMNRVENKHLKDLLLNLDVCCHHKANFGEVIAKLKKIYIKDKENKELLRKMYRNSFMGIIILVVIITWIIFRSADNALMVLWQGGLIGQLILIYLLVVSVIVLWTTALKAFM